MNKQFIDGALEVLRGDERQICEFVDLRCEGFSHWGLKKMTDSIIGCKL